MGRHGRKAQREGVSPRFLGLVDTTRDAQFQNEVKRELRRLAFPNGSWERENEDDQGLHDGHLLKSTFYT